MQTNQVGHGIEGNACTKYEYNSNDEVGGQDYVSSG